MLYIVHIISFCPALGHNGTLYEVYIRNKYIMTISTVHIFNYSVIHFHDCVMAAF